MRLALRLAARNFRAGLHGFGVFLACIVLGVAAVASVGTLSDALRQGLNDKGQVLLGGDIEIALSQRRMTAAESEAVDRLGEVSVAATLRAMAVGNGRRNLVEIKAVDEHYPLFGAAKVAPGTLADALRSDAGGLPGVAVDPLLMSRLSLAIGDRIELGSRSFEVRARIVDEPDRIADGFLFGPRVLMHASALDETGLVRPGSLVTWRYRVKLANPAAGAAVMRDLGARFPEAGWRLRSRDNAAPNVGAYIERLGFFLTLAGLTSLVTGGIGIANAVKAYVDRRRRQLLILRMVGAFPATGYVACLAEVVLVGLLGIAIGLAVGLAIPIVVRVAIGHLLPLPIPAGVYWHPLAFAAGFGILTILAFSLPPLARARDLEASELIRGQAGIRRTPFPLRDLAASAACLVLLAMLAFVAFDDARATRWYLVGFTAGAAGLAAFGYGLVALARRITPPRHALSRMAIANLHRPGTATPAIVLSLGLGLSLLAALSLLDRSLREELGASLPARAPSFFFLDVDTASRAPFVKLLESEPTVSDLDEAPMLRGRIVRVRDVPVANIEVAPDARWALRGDRGLTYADSPPAGSRLIDGDWWPSGYDGPPLVSFAEDIGRALQLRRGDQVTVNVLGREVTATVANFRAVDWRSLGINFVMVFSPNALRGAPHVNLMTVRVAPDREEALLNRIAAAFPTITAIRVRDALDQVNAFLSNVLLGLRAANGLSLLTGLLVMAGAWNAGLEARAYEAAVLKCCGATRRQVVALFSLEFLAIALVTAAVSILVGTGIAWMIAAFYLRIGFAFSLPAALAVAALAMALCLGAGLLTASRAFAARTPALLRRE